MDLEREDLRAWLRAVLQHMGWSGSDLAKRLDVVPSTINRFLNDPDATHRLSRKNLKAIALATGFDPLQMPGIAAPRGMAEPDAMPFRGEASTGDPLIDATVAQLIRDRNATDPWVLKSRALEHAGFLPGDVLIVDLNERAQARDIVCAQVYDWKRGRAETVFRIYEPPYLLAASQDGAFTKPLVVDDDAVVIKGVVVQTLRPRRSQAA